MFLLVFVLLLQKESLFLKYINLELQLQLICGHEVSSLKGIFTL